MDGSCVQFFENTQPKPAYYSGPEITNIGERAVLIKAAQEIIDLRSTDSPSVLAATVKCERLLDIVCCDNDDFITTLFKKIRPIALAEGIDGSAITQESFIGRILHSYKDLLPPERRPDAFRLRYKCDGLGECWSLAIIDSSAILSPRLIPTSLS